MFIFSYPQIWADIVVSQLLVSHNSMDINKWGYCCLCIGKRFDEIIEKHYEEIDLVTGKYFHVFSLTPPPKKIILKRIFEITGSNLDSKHKSLLLEQLDSFLKSGTIEKWHQISEKVELLKELKDAGLNINQYADFIFLKVVNESQSIRVESIAAKAAPLHENSSPQDYINFFQRLSVSAEKHYRDHKSIEEFVADLSLEWSIRIHLRNTYKLFQYIKEFFGFASQMKTF